MKVKVVVDDGDTWTKEMEIGTVEEMEKIIEEYGPARDGETNVAALTFNPAVLTLRRYGRGRD